jgi:transcriptional regulator with XRE-family HTH domain
MSSEHERFLARLKELQGEMKDAAFARYVSVPASTLKQYEKGSFPSIAVAVRIAEVYDVSLDWLCGREGATRAKPGVLNAYYLSEAISIVEDWLEAENREMLIRKKADLVTRIYQFIVDDVAEGGASLDRKKVQRMLHLVA